MSSYLYPVLTAIEDILEANYATEIASIDATLTAPDADTIRVEDFDLVADRYPFVQIFPRPGENEIESDLQNVNVIFKWQIVTAITIVGSSSTQLIDDLSKYMSAMLITIIKGSGTDPSGYYDLDGAVDLIRPVGWAHEDFINQETSELAKGGFLIWDVELEVDPAT